MTTTSPPCPMSYSIGITNEAFCRACGQGARGGLDAVLRWGNAHVCAVVAAATDADTAP